MSIKLNGSLSSDQLELFTSFVATLNPSQVAWISGYLAGLSAQGQGVSEVQSQSIAAVATEAVVSTGSEQPTLTILYGSRTGNGEGLAKKALKLATELGIKSTLKNMADYKTRDLQTEKNLLVIVSTHGAVSYTHLRAHETDSYLVCRLL